MGLGFTLALFSLGAIREFVGVGTVLGFSLFGDSYPQVILLLLPPGGFIVLGLVLALLNHVSSQTR
jgi:electron transport complex protein RnfE